jgi:hypothetical protein
MVACLSIIILVAIEVRTTTIMETTSSNSSVDPDLLEFKVETKATTTETLAKTDLNRTIKMFLNQF